MKKKVGIAIIVIISLCMVSLLLAYFYFSQHLYLRPRSDEDLLSMLFDRGFPGYAQISILEVEGEGIRRIPRRILIDVSMEAFPEPVTCTGEIFYGLGDPMALNVQWHTLQCVGLHHMMERARTAVQAGMKPTICHAETITNLLAHWVKTNVIAPAEINARDLRERVTALAHDEQYMASIPHLDGGLFDTGDVVVHDLVEEGGREGHPAHVLRCDGTLDLYLTVGRGQVYEVADMQAGDRLLPETLQP
jgi:hypothetical protein